MGDDTQAVVAGLALKCAVGAGEPGAAANPDGVETVADRTPKVAHASQPLGFGPKSLWDLKAARGAAGGRVGTGWSLARGMAARWSWKTWPKTNISFLRSLPSFCGQVLTVFFLAAKRHKNRKKRRRRRKVHGGARWWRAPRWWS